jgi:hypothetical protein
MKLLTDDISVGELQMKLILDDKAPVVKVGTTVYVSLSRLIKDYPDLLQEKYLTMYCKVANFLFTGIMFNFIENPEEYKRLYLKALHNAASPEYVYPSIGIKKPPIPLEEDCYRNGQFANMDPYTFLAETGPFDVMLMAVPQVKYGQLVFYVEDMIGQLPFRVISPYPYTREDSVVDYELLPPLKSA